MSLVLSDKDTVLPCIEGNGTILFSASFPQIEYIGSFTGNFLSARCITRGVCAEREYTEKGIDLRVRPSGEIPDGYEAAEVKISLNTLPGGTVGYISFAAMFDLTFSLSLDDGVRWEYFEKYSSRLRSRPCLKLISSAGQSLYCFADGDISFDAGKMLLHVRSGYSRIVISTSDEDLFTDLKHIFNYVPPVYRFKELRQEKLFADKTRLSLEKLESLGISKRTSAVILGISRLQSNLGGISLELGGTTKIEDMCKAFLLLLTAGARREADGFVSFICSLMRRYGELPYSIGADGGNGVFLCGTHNTAGDIVILSFLEYRKQFGTGYDREIMEICSRIISKDMTFAKGGALSFSGLEEAFSDGGYHPGQRFDGSFRASVNFINASRGYLAAFGELIGKSESRRVVSLADFVESMLEENFISNGIRFENCPERQSYIRYPSRIYGYCDKCLLPDHLGHKASGYLCRACAEKQKRKAMNEEDGYFPILKKYIERHGTRDELSLAELCLKAEKVLKSGLTEAKERETVLWSE